MPDLSDDDHEHGAHGRVPTRGERWEDFKKSPFLPATVLVFILAAAAGLFAGSYTYTMANPTPHRIPTAVVGAAVGVPVTVTDVKPLQKGDPRGLAIFYVSLAAVIIGFVGAIQLSVHARALNPLERIAYTVAYALAGAFVIAAVVDWWLGA